MAAALAHRGPDDEGIQTGPYWALVNRRLSIIGVESGHQPLSNEDGSVWVTFNGEIYNHRELRAELQAKGHIFSTSADTEVLVHLYEEAGEQFVERLCGMYAFALVDTRRRTLVLARDRLGQKPLNYCITRDGTVAFASELAALRPFPGMPRDLDRQALADYFCLGYIPAPRTIFAGVCKLPPAAVLSVAFGAETARLRRYWRPQFEPKERISFRAAAVRTRELLDAAVCKRLEAEVPLGAFLSGGIDSTAITALMQHHLAEPVHTFTIGFAEPRYDERAYAEIAARHLGTQHATQQAEPRDTALLRRLIRHCGEPYCDSSILPTALLSQFTRTQVTVALSGDGGDELFGGYQRYQVMALHRLCRGMPPALRRVLSDAALALLPQARAQRTALTTVRRLVGALGAPPLEAYMGFQGIFTAPLRAELMAVPEGPEVRDRTEAWKGLLQAGTAVEGVERFMELDLLEYLPGDLLCKVDIASMMFSLEVRSPFMDHDLIDFVTRLPRHYRVSLRHRKRLLKAAVADLIPPEIATRGKRGFGVPLGDWLRGELAGLVRETVLWQKDWDLDGFFDNATLRRLADEHLAGTQDHSFQLWAVLCFRLWLEEVYRPALS
jgi:asparagine synthase (glutamine-hydrolysing)